jgi:hypothetical protein
MHNHKLHNSTLFELYILRHSILTSTELELCDSCVFKVTSGGGEISHDCMELVYPVFITLTKSMTEDAKRFSLSSELKVFQVQKFCY